jgi:membrane-bound lytic murein transglycosylase D
VESVPSSTEDAVALEDLSFDWYIKSPKENATALPPVHENEGMVPTIAIADTVDKVVALQGTEPAVKSDHLVTSGETFYSIAKQYGVEVTALLAWNNLTLQNGLKPGQILKVIENEPFKDGGAENPTPASPKITHEVKPSDTLYSIARQYGVTIKDIMDWNHKTDFSLSRGEKLEIRQGNR